MSALPIFINPNTISHPDIAPYISVADYLNAPTAVDTGDLVNGGDAAAQVVELYELIRQACGWVNTLCGDQILAATLDTETAAGVYVRADGTIRLVCSFWPVLAVYSVSVGPAPNATVVLPGSGIFMDGRKVIGVPVASVGSYPISTELVGPMVVGSRAFCEWTYVNGWPHTALAADCDSGDTEIVVSYPLGEESAGRVLVIYDSGLTETITVATSFTGGTTLPLAAPLVNDHTAPDFPDTILVSALPPQARAATVCLVSQLVKQRGSEAIVLDSIGGEPSQTVPNQAKGFADLEMAKRLLQALRTVYG